MQLQKPQLFADRKSLAWVLLFFVMILLIRLFVHYQEYLSFVSKPFYYTYADVISEKSKYSRGKSYKVLKLHAENRLRFITTSYSKDSYANRRLRLQLFPDEKIGFRGYMGTFFVKSRIKEVQSVQSGYKERLLAKVTEQHNSETLGSFYNAIFFATPLPDTLRVQISKLGVSHLIALSGFHLGILWGIIYGLIKIAYTPLQQRYFPYRFILIDVGMVTLIVLGIYLWFVGFPPSLVRSYAMLLAGWGVLVAGMELLSFAFLFTVAGMLLALFPSLLFSLGFWLSVSGVFAIFLLLKYAQHIDKRIQALLIIPVGIFVLMLPVVHGIFGVTTPYQLLSPLLSLLFIPFYPLAMVLHLVGYGGVFDGVLLKLFALPAEAENHLLPAGMMYGYIVLALLSIRYRPAFVLLAGAASSYALYLFLL
ncbi:MAG: ComEC/Rec2 family competence protein [Campylobacterales bacterium]|nr:ComEC/Rec2 family competence protein [Campylobacterales bacterium]HEO99247.1 ComEC/Rec2 family competence protein [Campylobacterota bacterium]